MNYQEYTDKYFLRTNFILKQENLNPFVTMNVFARSTGKVAAFDEAIAIFEKYSTIKKDGGALWVTKNKYFAPKDTLMLIEAPIQSFVELETIYLGIMSDALSLANGYTRPDYNQVKAKVAQLCEIYQDIPITYFGARHYHYSLDKMIGQAAIEGGAIQTSTDIGSSNIGLPGVGTIPHTLVLLLAYKYGVENATLKAAELFDKYMTKDIPRVILIDTFNREISDGLTVAKYFADRQFILRVDTCGENIGQGGKAYITNHGFDPEFKTGNGVTVELVTNLKTQLIKHGYAKNSQLFLSSGFGNPDKAKIFVNANHQFRQKTGCNLFNGVGIGEVFPSVFCTADICAIAKEPFNKAGRKTQINYNNLSQVL